MCFIWLIVPTGYFKIPENKLLLLINCSKHKRKGMKEPFSVESAISANSFPCFPNHQSNVQHLKGSIHIVVLWQSFGVEQLVMWKLGWGLHLSQSCFNEVRSQPLGAASEHPTLANYPFKVRNVFFLLSIDGITFFDNANICCDWDHPFLFMLYSYN